MSNSHIPELRALHVKWLAKRAAVTGYVPLGRADLAAFYEALPALLDVAEAARALQTAAENQYIPMPVKYMLAGEEEPTEGSIVWANLRQALANLQGDGK